MGKAWKQIISKQCESAPNILREEETNSARKCWRRLYRGYDVYTIVKKRSRSSPEKAVERGALRWSVSRADEKDTGSVYLLPPAVLIFPCLTSGLPVTASPPVWSNHRLLSLLLWSPTPLSHTHRHSPHPFLTLAQIPETKSPAASQGSLGQKVLICRNPGIRHWAPDQSISHKEIKS